jgi:hypothetical protein
MLEQTAVSTVAIHVSLPWNEHLNMVGWEIHASDMSVGEEIPCASTRVHVHESSEKPNAWIF